MFSVVIPLYNKEEYISKTLQSVLDQKEINFEILIINDGSTDKSLQVVESFSDDRIYIHSIENKGVSAARNTGVSIASNEWICFLDADDWWAPNFLAEIKHAISIYSENRVFATGRNRVFSHIEERYSNQLLPATDKTQVINYFEVIAIDLPPINASNSVFHKSIFKDHTFNETMKQYEDHDLWARITATEEVVFINKPLSFYRKSIPDSGSKTVLRSSDFIAYTQTLQQVSKLNLGTSHSNLKAYCNRYIVFTFLKHHYQYSKVERIQILRHVKSILSAINYYFLYTIHIFSFLNFYGFFKFLKGNAKARS